jgi:uncharacterized iron-regulated membrane protein
MRTSIAPGAWIITLDAAIAVAQREGIGQRLWVGVPAGVDGIWTVAQTAMNEDITDPTQELTVHVDQAQVWHAPSFVAGLLSGL